jgi:nicotine oxidoreductase
MEHKDLQRLEALRKMNADSAWINSDLYRLLFKKNLYILAYERIKSKPGGMTPGVDGETLDGISMITIEKIIQEMRDESFQYSRARRVYIPKPNGKKRPLGIATTRDKLVQEILRMILEAIYDSPQGPTFKPVSHGFREGRGCHSALQEIHKNWCGVTWMIEGDIKGCFDNIDHEILITILRKRIKDERFINLIWKALKAGYLEFHTPVNNMAGTPQGSIVSPILANIYLHELDRFMQEKIKPKYEVGENRKIDPTYRKIQRRLEAVRAKMTGTEGETRKALVKQIKALKQELRNSSSIVRTGWIRIKYVRYADDWLVGINGPKATADVIREEIKDFLASTLKLELSLEKTHIRHAKTEEAFFLGTRIGIGSTRPKVTKVTSKGRTFTKRTAGWMPRLKAPCLKLVQRLGEKGFCNAEGNPASRQGWAVLDASQILSLYNSVLWGILNYYSFAGNYAELSRIQYILLHSGAKTLACKYKTSVKKIFRRHGKTLTFTVRGTDGKERKFSFRLETDWSNQPSRFMRGEGRTPNLLINVNLRTRSKLDSPCVICGEINGVAMHHVRHIRKMGEKVKGFHRVMAAINRKQIPVCDECHQRIHNGTYDGISLGNFTHPALARA